MSDTPKSSKSNAFLHVPSIIDQYPNCELVAVLDTADGLEIKISLAEGEPDQSIFFRTFRGYRSFDEGDLYAYFRTLSEPIRSGIYFAPESDFLSWAKLATSDPDSYEGVGHHLIASSNWVIEVLASSSEISL